MIVDIYVETTWKSFRKQTGFLSFLVITRYEGNPDNIEKMYCKQSYEITQQEALLKCTAQAIEHAVRMARHRGCKEFNIISSNAWVGNMYKNIGTWKKNGWKNAKGEDVKYAEYWMIIEKAAAGRTIQWIPERTKESGFDGYQDWLLRMMRMK